MLRRLQGPKTEMSTKGQRQRRRLQQSAPPSGQQPEMSLAPRDLTIMAEELRAYHARFHDLFQRREQREWSAFYLRGQLAGIERKTVEPMVLALQGPDLAAVRAGQQFLGEGAWADEPILARHQELVAESLGEPGGVVIVDGSGFPKQGTHSVGVARQYCGAVGKIANCQQGVFAAYVSRRGYTFLDRRLYMPEEWFDAAHAPLRQRYGVPTGLRFQTEPQLALAMVCGLVERAAVPFQWVVADEHSGMIPTFLDGVAAMGKWYLAEVPASTQVWEGEPEVEPAGRGSLGRPRTYARVAAGTPRAAEVRQIAARLPVRAWRRYTIKEGSKGPITADFACLRVTRVRRGRPGLAGWLVLRRSLDRAKEVKYFLSNAPASCPPATLVRVSGLRWPVEMAIEEAKGELGMDHYETRTWRGWHHHMTQTFLAHHFLVRLRLRLKKSPGLDPSPSPGAVSGRAATPSPEHPRSAGPRTLLSGAQLRRLSLPSPAHPATPSPAGTAAHEEC
jgi:SRSO17 transposase